MSCDGMKPRRVPWNSQYVIPRRPTYSRRARTHTRRKPPTTCVYTFVVTRKAVLKSRKMPPRSALRGRPTTQPAAAPSKTGRQGDKETRRPGDPDGNDVLTHGVRYCQPSQPPSNTKPSRGRG